MGGPRVGASTGGLSYQYSYNDKNQVLLSKNATDALNDNTFTYDAGGRMTAKTDRAGTFSFGYNARNDLTGITDPIGGFRVQAFNAAGQLTYVTQGTTLRTFGFDNAGRLASDELKNWSSNAILNSETYGYNGDDNLTSETNSGNGRIGSHTYTYDKAGRIASWATSTGTTAYTYDGAGNRLTAGAASYTYDARNRVLTGPASTYVWKNRGSPASQTV